MKLGDFVLRLLVRRRDRDTISGDLLEEYREHIQATRGPLAARLWYARQVVSFVSPLVWGILIGITLGAWQLIGTATNPLADDDAIGLVRAFGTVLVLWITASIAAGLRTRRFIDAIVAGVLVGLATMTVFSITSILRVNLFLEEIRYREDWGDLMARFNASGAQNLRTFANWEYLRLTPFVMGLGAGVGAVCGILAGSINAFGGRSLSQGSR